MELIHDRLLNNQFAPGIATYGIDGKDGKAGQSGSSFYFTSYSLEDQHQQDECMIKINRNMVLSEFVDVALQRKYTIGDLILDAVGKIYKIIQKNGKLALEYVSSVAGAEYDEYFKTSGNNRLYLDASFNGLDLIQGAEDNSLELETSSSDSIIRIANTKEDTKTGKFNMLQLLAKPSLGNERYLNISFDKVSDAFLIESDTDIVLDSSLIEVKSDNSRSSISLGNYYKITPYNDPIGLVHMMLSEASWDVIEGQIVIFGIDITHVSSLSLSPRFYVKVQDNEKTVIRQFDYSSEDGIIGKIYTDIEIQNKSLVETVSVIRGIEIFIPDTKEDNEQETNTP